MSRPIIGITAPTRMTKWGPWDMDATVIPSTYALAVIDGGGIPVILPPEDDSVDIISAIDGLVISGGPDIDPSMYGADLDPDTLDTYPKQDRREIGLIKASIEADLPVLGICRGMQIMCVAEGGSMHQHLPKTSGHESHGSWNGAFSDHEVTFEQGTEIQRMMGECVSVNSTHHQGVRDSGGLKVTGRANHDGLIESVTYEHLKFFHGLQWHPERMNQYQMYAALVNAARGS
ncbi:MAG: gamma-glutamyl-gamma-aminobutyrate hydrolase [Euryarchaeota archaeon]|nr:gamma-glutamyl-gamma-aminobutyrate hydrolase [Euryarchaeota archaeon]